MDIKDMSNMDNDEIRMHILDIKKDLSFIRKSIEENNCKFQEIQEKLKQQDDLNKKFIMFMNNVEFLSKLFMTFGGGSFISFLFYLYLKHLW